MIRDLELRNWVIDVESDAHRPRNFLAEAEAAWSKQSIYRVPEGYGNGNRRNAYNPQVVSFGPYHHGDKQLLPMEEHKNRVLFHFLERKKDIPLSRYAAALEEVAPQLMDSYKELEAAWQNRRKFLQLMLIDGFFMIEVLRSIDANSQKDYADNDPIFSKNGIVSNMPRIKRDMLMIENQIPLQVLKTLLSVEEAKFQEDKLVNKLVRDFFYPQTENKRGQKGLGLAQTEDARGQEELGLAQTEDTSRWEDLGLHVLDVVRKSMIKDVSYKSRETDPEPTMEVIWPATRLQEAGIEFKKSDSTSLKDVKFDIQLKCDIIFKKGILSLPQIDVDDATESRFLNLIAFEHLHAGAGKEVSSYVAFMDNIIDSDKDVILLSESNIIKNFVGTDQAVAELFNGLSHDISIDPASAFDVVHQEVTKHCTQPWNKYLAYLKHTHFKSPWSFIAFVTAAFALCLSVTQFVYSTINFIEKH